MLFILCSCTGQKGPADVVLTVALVRPPLDFRHFLLAAGWGLGGGCWSRDPLAPPSTHAHARTRTHSCTHKHRCGHTLSWYLGWQQLPWQRLQLNIKDLHLYCPCIISCYELAESMLCFSTWNLSEAQAVLRADPPLHTRSTAPNPGQILICSFHEDFQA